MLNANDNIWFKFTLDTVLCEVGRRVVDDAEKVVCKLVESEKVVLIVAMEFISAVPPTVHFIFDIGAVRLTGGWMRVQQSGTILRDYLNDGIQFPK
jgi:hypothetical protein